MKQQVAVKRVARSKNAVLYVIDEKALKPGSAVVFSKPTTRAKQRAAALALLKGMPPPVKPGEKSATELLAEYRAGGNVE